MGTQIAHVEINKDGLAINEDIQKAIDGFSDLNYEIMTFTYDDIITEKYWRVIPNRVFVGSIRTMRAIFQSLDKSVTDIDYPEELYPYLKRNIKKLKLNKALSFKNTFIKPVNTKLFNGGLYICEPQQSYFQQAGNIEVWSSEIIEDILSEWRCFVHGSEFAYAACYEGNFQEIPNWDDIGEMIHYYNRSGNSPKAYAIDVAVTPIKDTVLIEVSDFWAIGAYGLDSMKYAKMLKDRYFEIIS